MMKLVQTKIVKLFLEKRCLYVFTLFLLCTSSMGELSGENEHNNNRDEDVQVLVDDVMDFSHFVGSQLRSKDLPNKSDVYAVAPVTLFPSLVPRKPFEVANDIQETMNLLYFRISCDFDFLANTLSGADKYVKMLIDMAREAIEEGHQVPVKLLLERADYMFHINRDLDENDYNRYELKQIEVNIGPVGGTVNDNVYLLHRRVLSKAGISDKNLAPSRGIDTLAWGFYTAWQQFGDPNAIIILVHQEQSTMATPEQRQLQYEIERISGNKIKIVRISTQACGEKLQLREDEDFSLYLDHMKVAIVYFRMSFMVQKDKESLDIRRMLERSTAIKVPSLAEEMAGSKKVQQVMAKPGMLEKFLPEPEHAKHIESIRGTFAGLWGLEGEDEQTKAIIQSAIDHPDRYVLKPNREGGGHNIWGEDIATKLKEFTPEQRAGHILMQKLDPIVVKNYFVRPKIDVEFGHVISEISIFGALVGDQKTGKVAYNKGGQGYMMRTKWSDVNEGGILKGTGVYDSPLLF